MLSLAVHAGAPIRALDVQHHPSFSGLPDGHPALGSLLAVPLRYQGTSYGALCLANKQGAREFSEDDQVAANVFASQVALLLEIARMR